MRSDRGMTLLPRCPLRFWAECAILMPVFPWEVKDMTQQTGRMLRTTVCPLLAAFIWGSAFVAQSVGAETVPPFTFSAVRSWIGAISLLILSFIIRKRTLIPVEHRPRYRQDLLVGGICCGLMLAIATNLQQAGMADTDAGKAGFLTSLYVVLVPIFGLFCNRRASAAVWIGIGVALVGLYLLCITDTFSIAPGDGVILLCAVFFALQILFIDRFSPRVNGIHLSCVQLMVSATVSTVCALLFERSEPQLIWQAWLPLLYVGLFSSGIAYTLQTLSLKNTNPTVVTLLLSLESVFSVLTGWLILGDTLSIRESVGCLLMFGAVTLANLPIRTRQPVENEQ